MPESGREYKSFVGPETVGSLNHAPDPNPAPHETIVFKPSAGFGSGGYSVADLQRRGERECQRHVVGHLM